MSRAAAVIHRTRAWLLAGALLALATGCSDSPELIDAGEDGGLAFIAFTIMVVVFVLFLFSLDRIRQRREERSDH